MSTVPQLCETLWLSQINNTSKLT